MLVSAASILLCAQVLAASPPLAAAQLDSVSPVLPASLTLRLAPAPLSGATSLHLAAGVMGRADGIAQDTTHRPRAIEYSDAYFTRLRIHRIGSFAMLPLFAGQWMLGRRLEGRGPIASWVRPAHRATAEAISVVFAVNTVTGAWNLWDSRKDPAGRTRRTMHTALMLASDAGFAITGLVAEDDREDGRSRLSMHRDVAIGSMALSVIGAGMMWLWKD
jgi:hypothetical protein